LFTINCTGVREKKINFSHWFFKKKKKLNIATVEHGSTVPKNNYEKQHFAASPILRLGSKNQWTLPSKIKFVSFTKHKNVWLRVNLTRSHNNKQILIFILNAFVVLFRCSLALPYRSRYHLSILKKKAKQKIHPSLIN